MPSEAWALAAAAESEVLLRLDAHGVRMDWVPVRPIYGDEVSSIHPVRDTLRFLDALPDDEHFKLFSPPGKPAGAHRAQRGRGGAAPAAPARPGSMRRMESGRGNGRLT